MKPIELALSLNDVLLVPQFSSTHTRAEIDLTTHIAPDIELKIPLITTNMDTITGVPMAVAMSKLGGISYIGRWDTPQIQADKVAQIKKAGGRAIGVIGVKDDYMKRAELLLQAGSLALHLDIAHGHSAHALQVIADCKNKFPKISMIAGTIATYQGAMDLYKAGADTVKVNIGGGSICITRIVAGAGVPQITAIMEATRAKNQLKNKYVIADAGATSSGDIVKALAAGADAYEGGNLFAGTDETPGTLIKLDGKLYKEYSGSTSLIEKKRQLKMDKEGKSATYALHVEGVHGMVQYKGPVKDIVAGLCAGIRSGLSYSGAKNITELHEKAQFIQITSAGLQESHAHDIILRP